MQAVSAAPFLADKRLIIIDNLFSSSDRSALDKWLQFLDGPISSSSRAISNVVVFWENAAAAKTCQLWDFLIKQPYSQNFELLEGAKLIDWINKEAKILGLGIDSAVSRLLAEFSEGDLWRLNNELAKAAALATSKNKQRIEKEEVAYLDQHLNDDVFNFIEILMSRRPKEALGLLHNLWIKEVSEAEVFGAIIWQIKSLLTLKNYYDINRGADLTAAAKELHLHPFVVKKSLPLLRRFSFDKLKSFYQLLLDLDIKNKNSAAPFPTLFDLLVAKMSAI